MTKKTYVLRTVFALVYFVFEGKFLYSEGVNLTKGFLRFELGGVIFGGAYFRNFTLYNLLVSFVTAFRFQYDAFIIYSSGDTQWMKKYLLPLLEGKLDLKCCIHYRDFVPGIPLVECVFQSVYASRKTVAVVSKNVFRSRWCQYELQVAFYRRLKLRDDSLIFIKLDDFDTKELPFKELRGRYPTLPYIDCSNSAKDKTWETKLVNFLKVPVPGKVNTSVVLI